MSHRSYIVRFYKKAEKRGDKDTYLGQVEIDDIGVSQHLTIAGKAFRQAPPRCLGANKLHIERV
jgi:hypothetical protein